MDYAPVLPTIRLDPAPLRDRFRIAFDKAPVGMMLSDSRLRILRVNAALGKMLGYRAGEIGRIERGALLHPDDRALFEALNEELFNGKRMAYQVEKRYRHKDGRVLWCKVDAALADRVRGLPKFSISTLEDVTDRKYLEASRQRLLGNYELILNTAGWGVLAVDRLGAITFVNPVAAARLGWPARELLGQQAWALRQTPVCGRLRFDECPILGALRDGLTRHHGSCVFLCRNGSPFRAELTVAPIIGDDGMVGGAVLTFVQAGHGDGI